MTASKVRISRRSMRRATGTRSGGMSRVMCWRRRACVTDWGLHLGDMADWALEQVIEGINGEDYSVDEEHNENNTCPRCDAPLVMRVNRRTRAAFRGCSRFP